MEIKKSFLLSFLYIHTLFISTLGSATPIKSNYRQKHNENCVCIETNPHRKKIPEILDPANKGIERLVIFAYRTPDGTIYTYIPEMNKQSGGILPDFQYENGDFLDINAEEPLKKIFLNHKKNHDLGWFWRDQPIPRPQDNKSNINKNQHHLVVDPVKITQKPKPYIPTNKHHVVNWQIPQDSEFERTPLNSVRKHRLFWKDSSALLQDSGTDTFTSKDPTEYDDWTENEHHFTNKPNSHKNLNNNQPFWQEIGYPHNSKSIYIPSKNPLEKDNAKKTKQNYVTNKHKPYHHNMHTNKIPHKLPKLNSYRIQGPKKSEIYLPTESKEDEKIPPLFYFSDSDKDADPFLFDPNNINFQYNPKLTDKEPQPFDQHSRYTPLKQTPKGSNYIFDRVKPKYIPVPSEEKDDLLQKELYSIESTETSIVPNYLKKKFKDVHKYPISFDPHNINFRYIPEITGKKPQLFDQHSRYMPLKQAPKLPNHVFDRVKPNKVKHKYIPVTSEEKYNLYQKELHNIESPETSLYPNNMKNKIFIDKHRPVAPLKKELNSVNMFLIDEDMLDNHWKNTTRENFGSISSTQREPGVSFDKWFLKQMKNNDLGISIKQPIEYKALQHFVEVALKRHGMFVSPKGDLRDSNGNNLDMRNINLRRLLIGDSLEYYKLRENPDGTFRFPKNSPYMESLLIALLNPPKIIGIIPLGKVKLPSPLDFTSISKRPKQYTTSVEHTEVKDISDISHNNKLLNEQKSINSKNEFIMVNPINQSLKKPIELRSRDEEDLQQSILDIFNDSVPISKSKYSHVFRTNTNTKNHLSGSKSAPKISEENSSELPIQTVLSLLHKIVDKHKDEITPQILNKNNKLLESLGIFKEKKLQGSLVKDPSAATVQKQKIVRKEEAKPNKTLDKNKKPKIGKPKNLLAQYGKPKKVEVKQNKALDKNRETQNAKPEPNLTSSEHEELEKEVTKSNKKLKKKKKPSLIPRLIHNIHKSVVGGEALDDTDHDFRIIGGAAATGSGRPINNRGRSGDKDISLY